MKFPAFRFILGVIVLGAAGMVNAVFDRWIVPQVAVTTGLSDGPEQIFGTNLAQMVPEVVFAVAILLVIALFKPEIKAAFKALKS